MSTHRWIRTVAIALALAAAPGAAARTPAQAGKTFYPASDAAKDIAAALSAATKDGKHVLLDFGADWCPDCRVLGTLFEREDVAKLAADNFHIVRVDVGRRDKNDDVVEKYHATSGEWIPAIVVLRADGTSVAATNQQVRVTRKTTAEELTALLREWAPKPRVIDLASFVEHGVRVSVGLNRDRSQSLWLSGTFAPVQPGTHLYSIDLPARGIDGLGRPTRMSLDSGSGLRPVGPAIADRPVIQERIPELGTVLPVYPDGPVTVLVPVTMTSGSPAQVGVSISYMACGSNGCLAPVIDKRIYFQVNVK